MESVLSLIVSAFNAENVRMLVIIAIVWTGYVRLNSRIDRRIDDTNKRMDGLEVSLNKRIDGVEASIKELKYNDFAHLNSTIEALTYALEKNGSLKREDKEYVDTRLAH